MGMLGSTGEGTWLHGQDGGLCHPWLFFMQAFWGLGWYRESLHSACKLLMGSGCAVAVLQQFSCASAVPQFPRLCSTCWFPG